MREYQRGRDLSRQHSCRVTGYRSLLALAIVLYLMSIPAGLAGQTTRLPTSILIWSDPNGGMIHQPITFYAEVIGNGVLAPTGTVTFNNLGAPIGAAPVATVTNTNYLRFSAQFDKPAWNLADGKAVITPNYTANPLDDQKTAFRYQNTASDKGAALYQDIAGLPQGQRVTFSLWIKGNIARHQDVSIAIIDNQHHRVSENPCYLTSDWQRCWVTTAERTSDVFVRIGSTDTLWGWDASIWGAQVEAAASVGPYISSTDRPATATVGLASFTTALDDDNNSITSDYGEGVWCPCITNPHADISGRIFPLDCFQCAPAVQNWLPQF